ncbi:MAG: hypothetical protein J7K87_03540 [Candidatus Aenigmarchaeota archaeon]|nr:hypothetical protein [Candidatus Aenigmarchaeota archaeon]
MLILIAPRSALADTFIAKEVDFSVSPDESFNELTKLIDDTKNSLYMATYTFDNFDIAKKLVGIKRKGVNIIVMIEGKPAGGLGETKNIASFLSENGIPVYMADGNFRYNHAKYAIFDNKTFLISTENFDYTGFSPDPSYGNRGWLAIVKSKNASKYVKNLFFNDLKNSKRFYGEYKNKTFETKSGAYSPKFGIGSCKNVKVDVFVAPNATDDIINFLNDSKNKILVEQFYIYKYWKDRINPFVEEIIKKSKNGTEVKVLVDSTWYVSKKNDPKSNYNTAAYLKSNGINAKLFDKSKTNLIKIHAKGIINDDSVLLSSVNWNQNSPEKNREIGIVIHCEGASDYFSKVFEYDWNGEKEEDHAIFIYIGAALIFIFIIFRKVKRI